MNRKKLTGDYYYGILLQIPDMDDIRQQYALIERVLTECVNEQVKHHEINFVGFFAKIDYLLKEHDAQWMDRSVPHAVNDLRIRLRKGDMTDEEMRRHLMYDMAALCKFIGVVYDTLVPESLSRHFPAKVEKSGKRLLGRRLRVVVDHWDNQFIYATRADSVEECRIDYLYQDKYSLGDWKYVIPLLTKGDQLNIVRPREQDGIIYPELIIYAPDSLVDITAIANCFNDYGVTPYTYIINKLQPCEDTEPMILGNFVSQMLDELLHHQFRSEEDSYRIFFRHHALQLSVCPPGKDFHTLAAQQAETMRKVLDETLHEVTGTPYNAVNVILEPSFFSEMLGLQGRMDFLQRDMNVMIEQKSGKGAYPGNQDPEQPRYQEKHYVQMLLYRALLHYNYDQRYEQLYTFLLYSKYKKGLLMLASAPRLLFEAFKLRNQIAWSEEWMAKGGLKFLTQVTPERLYPAWNKNPRFWNTYIRPRIMDLLQPIQEATPLERAYFLRYEAFLQREHLLSKLGNRTKENSGFASAWLDSLAQKKQAGNIYDGLALQHLQKDDDGNIAELSFEFSEETNLEMNTDMSNFRKGDIVLAYAYDRTAKPDATHAIVFRGNVVDIMASGVKVRLRNPQTDPQVFAYDHSCWAIEHDFIESSDNALSQSMLSFLCATKRRRDLILSQRLPEIDTSLTLKGDYTDSMTGHTEFNDLVLRVKQAQDFFLIIGPPGTGKTSFGMLNVLKEQLLEPGTSVLLLSFTNRAVDEICSKLVKAGIDFLRLGSDLSCDEAFRSHLMTERTARCNSEKEVLRMLQQTRVVCGTTTSLNSHISLLKIKKFELAIVDEASQILEPHIIGLLSAQYDSEDAIGKFVLIGDEKQLPAVVQQTPEESKVTDAELLQIKLTDCRLSLFERLIKTYRNGAQQNAYCYLLTRQGRMHQDIAAFPNHSFYQGNLQPVPLDYQVAVTPTVGDSNNPWVNLLETHRVAFVACQSAESFEHPELSDKVNVAEAQLIARAVYAAYLLYRDGFSLNDTVGVIVPYRNQIATVRNAISLYAGQYGAEFLRGISIDTVERYQGSQRRVIIYGFTVKRYYQLDFLTNNTYVDEFSGDLIDRKLNVVMTRAMEKLILIGNPSLLQESRVFRKLLEYVHETKNLVRM